MRILVIRYNAPTSDPTKSPRPHWIDTETGIASGGEEGEALHFVCVHPAIDPQANGGPVLLDEIVYDLERNEDQTAFSGWRAAFEHDYEDTFSLLYTIDRIELL